MLFNEPKLLKWSTPPRATAPLRRFSALQRAEIAEMDDGRVGAGDGRRFSALQRAEIAEMLRASHPRAVGIGFSALQRAEIAEIRRRRR